MKTPGTIAGRKNRNVSSNCRWEPAHNAIWTKSFRKLETVYIYAQEQCREPIKGPQKKRSSLTEDESALFVYLYLFVYDLDIPMKASTPMNAIGDVDWVGVSWAFTWGSNSTLHLSLLRR